MHKNMKRIIAILLVLCTLASFIVPTVVAEGEPEIRNYLFKDGKGRTIKVRTWGDGGTYTEPDFANSNPKLTMATGSDAWTFAGRSLSGNKGTADGTRINITGNTLTVYFDEKNASSSTNGDWIALKLENVPVGTYELEFTAAADANNGGNVDVFMLPAGEYSAVYADYMSLTEANAGTVREKVNSGMQTLLAGKQALGVVNSKEAAAQVLGDYTCGITGDYVLVFRSSANQTGNCRLALASLKMTPKASQDDTDQIAAMTVQSLIDTIGDVTLDSEEQIVAAREAYNALTDVQKALVTNYEVLVSAEAALEILKENIPQGETLKYAFTAKQNKTQSQMAVLTWGDSVSSCTIYNDGSHITPDYNPEISRHWEYVGRSLSGKTGTADGSRITIKNSGLLAFFTESAGSSTNGDWIALMLTDIPAGTYAFTFTGPGGNNTGRADVFVMPFADYSQVDGAYTSLTQENAESVRPVVNENMKTLLAGKTPVGVFDSTSAEDQNIGTYTCATTGDYVLVFRCAENQTGNCRLSLTGLEMTQTVADDEQDNTAVDIVIALIDGIGEVTLDSQEAIAAARAAYDALPPEQQALVTNYGVLAAAEEAFEQLQQGNTQFATIDFSFTNAQTIKVRTWGDGGSYTEPNFPQLSIPGENGKWTFVGRSLSGNKGSADGSRVNINQSALTAYFTEDASSSTNGDWVALKLKDIPAGAYKMIFTAASDRYAGKADVFMMPEAEYEAIYADYMSLTESNASTVRGKVNDAMKTLLAGKLALGVFDATDAQAQTVGVYNCQEAGDYVLVFRCSKDQTGNCRLVVASLKMEQTEISNTEDPAAVDNVIALINAIGNVTLDSENAINTARAHYNALSEAQKAQVTNYAVLTAAEIAFARLEEAEKALIKYAFVSKVKTVKVRTWGDGGTYVEPNFAGLTLDTNSAVWTFAGRNLSGKTGTADGSRVNISQESLVVYFTESALSSTNGDWIALKLENVPAGTYKLTFTAAGGNNNGLADVFMLSASEYADVYGDYMSLTQANADTVRGKVNSGMKTLLAGKQPLGVLDSTKTDSQALGIYNCQSDGDYILVFRCATNQAGNCRLALNGLELKPLSNSEIDQEMAQIVINKIQSIGEVSVDSESAIASARKAYDALTEAQKALVTNYSVLVAAEAAFSQLKQDSAGKYKLEYSFKNPKTIKVRTEGDDGTYKEPEFSGLTIADGFKPWTFVGRSLSGKTGSADGSRVNINKNGLTAYFSESAATSSTNGDWIAVKLTNVPAGDYAMIFANYYAASTGSANVYVMPAAAYGAVDGYYQAMDKTNVNKAMVELLSDIDNGKIENAKNIGVFNSAMNPSAQQNLGVYSCPTDGDYILVFRCAAKQAGNCRLSLANLTMQSLTAEQVKTQLVSAVITKIDAIGEVTLASEDVIAAARSAYNALTAELKPLVTNYSRLTSAEYKLAKMKQEAATTYKFVNDKTIKVRTAGDEGTYTEPYFSGLKIEPGYGVWTFVGRSLTGKTGTADGSRVNINQGSMVVYFTEGNATSSSGGDWIAIELKDVKADMYKLMFTNASGSANGLADVYIMPAAAYTTVGDYYKKLDQDNVNKSMAQLLAAIDNGEIEYAKRLEKQFNSEQNPAGPQRLDVLNIEKSGNYVIVFRCAANQSGDCRTVITNLRLISTTAEQIEQEEIDDVEALIDAIGEVYMPEAAVDFARNDYTRIKDMFEVDTATYAELGRAILFLIETIQSVSIYAETNIAIAREAYDSLTSSQKEKVENYAVLAEAEETLAKIRQDLANEKAAVDAEVVKYVQTMINGIGEVTAKSYSQIKKARVAYNWLTLEQKAMIDTYDVLVKAESDYIALTGNFETVVESVTLMSSVSTKFNVGNNDFVATSVVNGHDYLYVPHNYNLYVYDLDTRTKVDEESIGFSETDGIFIDSKGIVWVYGQKANMYRYDPYTGMGKSTSVLLVNGSANKTHVYYPIEVDGKLYVGSYNYGELAVYNPATNQFTNLGQLVEGGVKLTTLAYKDGYLYASVHAANNSQNPHALVKYELATKQVVGTFDLRGGGYLQTSPYLTQTIIVGDVLLGATSKKEKMLAVDINTMQAVDIGTNDGVVHGFSQLIEEEDGSESVYFLGRGSGYTLYKYNSKTGRATSAGFDITGTSQFNTRGNSFITLEKDGREVQYMLIGMQGDGTVSMYNMETKKVEKIEGITGQDGSSINLLDFRAGGPEGASEIYFGGFMSNQANVYDIKTNTITKQYTAYSEQLETSQWFNNTWYVTGYGACSISEMDYDTGECKVLFTLNEKDHNNFVQERIHALAYGDNKIFGTTIPQKNILGGFIVWYDYEKEATFVAVEADKVLYQPDSDRSVWRDAKTDEIVEFNTEDGGQNDFKGVLEYQTINGIFYQNGYLYGTSYIAGGSGSAPVEGANSELIVYDVEKMELVAHYPINEQIEGLVTPVELIGVWAPDPEIEGKFWGVVAATLFTATFDAEDHSVKVEEVVSYNKEFYKGYMSKYKTGQMYFTDGYVLIYFKTSDDETEAGINNLRLINIEDPSYNYSLCTEGMGGYVLADDGNVYFNKSRGIGVLYTSNIIAAIKENKIAADAVTELIAAIGSDITLDSEAAILAARAAFDNLSIVQKTIVKTENVLADAEAKLQALKAAQLKTTIITVGAIAVVALGTTATVVVVKRKKKSSKNAQIK